MCSLTLPELPFLLQNSNYELDAYDPLPDAPPIKVCSILLRLWVYTSSCVLSGALASMPLLCHHTP